MLTIFTTPKDFKGHFAIIQENAIASWCKLQPEYQIILLGKGYRVSEIAKKYHALHIPDVKTSTTGTPLVSDLFYKAQKIAKFPILAYVNSDVILLEDFSKSIQKIKLKPFLVIGHRWELRVNHKINFDKDWRKRLSKELQKWGEIKSN